MADADLDQLRRISAALDGDGEMPDPLDADGQAFLAAAQRLRSLARLEEAVSPPDVTDAVLRSLPPTRVRRPAAPHRLVLTAAAVFVVAALVTAVLVRDNGPLGSDAAVADVGDELLEAQTAVLAIDAEVTVVERGAAPAVPVRRYVGALHYDAPERLWLHLEDQTDRPPGWPANDVDLVIDEQVAWSTGLRDRPVGEQPGCLRADSRVVAGSAPFSADHVAPLDLIVPAGAFLPSADVSSSEDGDALVLDTTVARVQDAIDGLRGGGALRAVHPTDRVRLELDAESFTIRRLTVVAGAAPSRVTWAATHGYSEAPGTEILDVRIHPTDVDDTPFPSLPATPGRTAGFDDGLEVDGPIPSYLPRGYDAHRDGVLVTSGPDLSIRTWTNGRAWIRLDITDDPTGATLLGGLGPVARPIKVGDGVGYTDPMGRTVALHTDGLEVALSGSVPLDTLVRVAASLPLAGRAVPDDWAQAGALDELPDGALGSGSVLIARYDGDDLVVVLPGPGATSAVLRQAPGDRLPPPSPDAVDATARGVSGRYDPVTSRLEWVDHGWVRSLQSEGRDLEALQQLAADLERA